MKKIFVLFIAAALVTVACNNDNQADSVKNAEKQNDRNDSSVTLLGDNTDSLDFDKDFMVETASGGLLEVQLGELAQKNASAAAVKKFGQMMVTDHTKANAELTALAKQKNIVVPSVPGEEAQENISKLQQVTGKDFDKEYVNLMVEDHKNDIDQFEKAAEKAKDPEIKALATKTLPTLRHHLQMIQAIHDGMK
jgi:putative membrane protein